MKYAINATDVPEPIGPYSLGTAAGRLVFASGQLAIDPNDNTKIIEAGVKEQTDRILDIVENILSEVKCTLSDVAQTTVYLSNIEDIDEVNEVFRRRFSKPAPARAVVAVNALPLGAAIEMDCIACR